MFGDPRDPLRVDWPQVVGMILTVAVIVSLFAAVVMVLPGCAHQRVHPDGTVDLWQWDFENIERLAGASETWAETYRRIKEIREQYEPDDPDAWEELFMLYLKDRLLEETGDAPE